MGGFSEQRGSFAEAVANETRAAERKKATPYREEFLCAACLRTHKRHDEQCRKFRERRFAEQERERKRREAA